MTMNQKVKILELIQELRNALDDFDVQLSHEIADGIEEILVERATTKGDILDILSDKIEEEEILDDFIDNYTETP